MTGWAQIGHWPSLIDTILWSVVLYGKGDYCAPLTALSPSTNKLLTDWDKNIINLNFSTARLTKTISTTVYLNLVKHRFNKRIGNLMSFNKRTFLHTGSLALPTLLHCLSWASPIMLRSTLRSWICDVLVSLVAGGFVACIVRAWQCGWVRG